jgi:hypothetical protein
MVQAGHLVGAADHGKAIEGALMPFGIGGSCERTADDGSRDDQNGQSPTRGGHQLRV